MANTIRIKRRITGGVGAPGALKNAELAYNEVDNVLYYGKGDAGDGTATSIIQIGGSGAFATVSYVDGTFAKLGANNTFAAGFTNTFNGAANFVGAFQINGTAVTADAVELNLLDGATAGSAVAGKVLVVNSQRDIANINALAAASFKNTTESFTVSSAGALTASSLTSANLNVGSSALTVSTTAAAFSVALAATAINSSGTITGASLVATGDVYANTNKKLATEEYVSSVQQGLDVKQSVRVATTANITLSGTQTIDGVDVIAGDRVLVRAQTDAKQNGIYVVAAGSWARASDANANANVTAGLFTFVTEGTQYADSGWILTANDAITLGTSNLDFVQFSGAGMITIDAASTARVTTGLEKDGNFLRLDVRLKRIAGLATVAADQLIYASGTDTFATTSFTSYGRSLVDDVDATAARTTLGLGTMATQNANNVAITGGTIDNIVLDGGSF